MKMHIYTIYDELAKEYGPLFEAKNDFVALRNFRNMKIPGPAFKLFKLGSVDREDECITVDTGSRIVEVTDAPSES
jgi:hypothetical protein